MSAEAIAYHHQPSQISGGTSSEAITALHIANFIVQGEKNEKDEFNLLDIDYINSIGLNEKVIEWQKEYRAVSLKGD